MNRHLWLGLTFLISTNTLRAEATPFPAGGRGGLQPPKPADFFMCRAGTTREDVFIFPNRVDNILEHSLAGRFFYTPPLFFQKLPGDDAAYVEVTENGGDEVDATLFLVRSNPEVTSCMVSQGSRRTGKALDESEFMPIPMLVVNVQVSNPNLFPFPLQFWFPSLDDIYTNWIGGADLYPITFRVPRTHIDEFLYYVENGLEFTVRYAYGSAAAAVNTLAGTTSVSVSADDEQEFFGDRDTIWATADQIKRLFINSTAEHDWKAVISDERVAPLILSQADKFLSSVAQTGRELATLAGQYVSSYGLDPNDDFFTPDYTSSTNKQMASTKERLAIMAHCAEEYSKKGKGGGGSFLWGLMKGSGGKASESSRSDCGKSATQSRSESAEIDQWEGRRTEALRMKLYQVARGALNTFVKVQMEIAVISDPNVTKLGIRRHTQRNTWIWNSSYTRNDR